MQAKVEKIHSASMAILQKVGIKLHHPEICSMLAQNGVSVEGRIAYFTEKQILNWVGKAPETFTVHARNPEHNAVIGDGQPQYIAGYGCPAIIDAVGNRRDATLNDYIQLIKLVQQSDGFRINGGIIVQPTELPANQAHTVMTYTTMLFSDKCLMGQPGPPEALEKIMGMAAIAFGGREALIQKPKVLTLVNTLSPLQIDRMALDTIRVHAEYGQALVLAAGVMCGTTAPITPAGALAMANAEVLAAIVISQMLREGTPVVMGILIAPADMRTGALQLGAPAHATCIRYAKVLSNLYGIPCRCGGCGSDAEGLTAQSGYESMLNMFVSLEEKVDLIIHSAGVLSSYRGMCFEKFIMDLEVIGMMEHHFADIPVNDTSLALSVIADIGHGGQFLTHRHTLEGCRNVPWTSMLDGIGHQKNEADAQATYLAKINGTLKRILSSYRKPEIDPSLRIDLENFMIKNGVDAKHLQILGEATTRI